MNWLAFVCIAVGAYNVGMLIYLTFDVDSLVTEQERGVYGSRSFADAICQAGIETQKNHQKQNRREGMSKGNEPAYPSSKTWNSGVDVLAVMRLISVQCLPMSRVGEMEDARAAVAELIEAAEDISLYELDCPPSYFRRLDDALRRVKGESE